MGFAFQPADWGGWITQNSSSFLSAAARHQRVGVNLERPQAKPRTNEIDAGEEWRILGAKDEVPFVSGGLL